MKNSKFLNINSSVQSQDENDLALIKKNEKNKVFLDRMHKIATDNEGTLLSTEWNGSAKTYQFQDKEKRTFSIKYSHLIDRGWPKDVEKFLALSESFKLDKSEYLKKLSDIAVEHNAKLLSTEWLTTNDKYVFQFENGEIFEMVAREVFKNKFPKDADNYFKQFKARTKTKQEHFNDLKEIALKHGGKVLSTEWTHAKDKYIFENQFGEQYEMIYDNFRRFGFPKSSKTKIDRLKK